MLGTGSQLLLMSLCVLFLCLVGTISPTSRGALYLAFVVLYSFTAGVAGYVSCYHYIAWGGENWVRNILTTAFTFSGPFAIVATYLNLIAYWHGSRSTIPLITVLLLVVVWALVTLPLTVVGSVVGKHRAEKAPPTPPVQPNIRPRELPETVQWYACAPFQVMFAGFLPFSAIYMELFYIFTSVWGYKLYTLYGILALALILLVVVTAMITIALVYFQLTAEDYRWWWRSYACGASLGLFVYLYSSYYFLFKSGMFGFLQTSFFFGYMLVLSFGVALGMGTVGFFSSRAFVYFIYSRAKLA